jgi:hypothetical protein
MRESKAGLVNVRVFIRPIGRKLRSRVQGYERYLRIASVLLFVAAAGNTYGLLRFRQAVGPMAPVHFPVGHAGFSYFQVVFGYQAFFSLYVLWRHT